MPIFDEFERSIVNEKLKEQGKKEISQGELFEQMATWDKIIIQELKARGMSNTEILIARQHVEKVDVRQYGMEKLGWKRVKDNMVETWNLTEKDLRGIANGLGDADEEMEDDETFDIEVRSSGNMFRDVPITVIESKNLAELFPYGERSYHLS